MLEPIKETVIHKEKSATPFYIIAGIWVVGSLIFKMYKLYPYLILTALSIAAYIFMDKKQLFKDKEIAVEVETPRSYASQMQQEFIEAGTENLKKIVDHEEKIKKLEFKQEVAGLVTITDKILDYVYEHAQAAQGLRKIVHYYLPTIENLLSRYLDIQDEDTQNAVDSKIKIEGLIKTTRTAFENQYNDLFDSDTLDINSEVKVLEKILVQEGLIDLNTNK